MNGLVTVWPDARQVGWTGQLSLRGEYMGTPGRFGKPRLAAAYDHYPLRVALDVRYSTDAHYVPYVLHYEGRPALTPRCNKSAAETIDVLSGEILFSVLTLDCDDPVAHEEHIPARREWRADWWRRLSRLPVPVGAYSTRGGGRIVCELHEPVGERAYFEALSGLHAFAADEGIVADRFVDAQRCYRLPFVTRDGEMQERRLQSYDRALSEDEQTAVTRLGRQYPIAEPVPVRIAAPPPRPSSPDVRMKPGERLHHEVSWSQILEPTGARFGGMRGEQEVWYRPGKKSTFNGAPSALTNYGGSGRLKILSSNWPGFSQGQCVDKLGAIMAIEGLGLRDAVLWAVARFNL